MEMSIYVGGSLLSMDVSGSFHGSTRKFPQSVEVKDSIASIIGSFYEHIPWKLTCASIHPTILLPTSASITNVQELPQDFSKGPPISVRSAYLDVSPNFHGRFRGS